MIVKPEPTIADDQNYVNFVTISCYQDGNCLIWCHFLAESINCLVP